jgi:transposase
LGRCGAPWRDLPAAYGPWRTVASRFYRWEQQGVWARVLAALQAQAEARSELEWLLHYLDSTIVRAHQHAAGAKGGTRRRKPPAAVAADSAPSSMCERRAGVGRSRSC